VDEFRRVSPSLATLGQSLRDRLAALLEAARVPVHSVTARIKSEPSLAHKLARPDKSYRALWDVTDLLGLRVETYFEDHLEAVSRLVEQHFRVDFHHSAARERPAGYRSIHYVCALDAGAPHERFRFEVQLRTVLQHAWAEVEHDLGYKADSEVPEAIRRRFARVASLLEIADQEFVSIRAELEASQRRARELLEQRDGSLRLDVVSLDALTRHPSIAALDETLATTLGRPRTDEPFFPDYLVRFLRGVGLDTTAQVIALAEAHRGHFATDFAAYARGARAVLQFDVDGLKELQRGYALLPLAHLGVARAGQTKLQAVARLARVYEALEFPQDEGAAVRVATALLDELSKLHSSTAQGVSPP